MSEITELRERLDRMSEWIKAREEDLRLREVAMAGMVQAAIERVEGMQDSYRAVWERMMDEVRELKQTTLEDVDPIRALAKDIAECMDGDMSPLEEDCVEEQAYKAIKRILLVRKAVDSV